MPYVPDQVSYTELVAPDRHCQVTRVMQSRLAGWCARASNGRCLSRNMFRQARECFSSVHRSFSISVYCGQPGERASRHGPAQSVPRCNPIVSRHCNLSTASLLVAIQWQLILICHRDRKGGRPFRDPTHTDDTVAQYTQSIGQRSRIFMCPALKTVFQPASGTHAPTANIHGARVHTRIAPTRSAYTTYEARMIRRTTYMMTPTRFSSVHGMSGENAPTPP
ncbi:hypothetical protein BDW22DRAFT_430671 [Trametopsis cervina]|nr:hypothetical protein BDW22DRAFT_430671 [Trametopsis cervina]